MDPRPIVLKQLDTSSTEFLQLLAELKSLVSNFGLELQDNELQVCLEHLLYVMQVNEYINLTRITDVHEALVLHILDSLSLLPYLNSDTGSLLDMGSGAGFPGIPMAACSDLSVTLLDSVGKKIKADNAIIKQLGLTNVHGVHDRLESFAVTLSGQFDYVVARALAPLPMLIEYASPFLRLNGLLVLSKGNPSSEELEAGSKASNICGLKFVSSDEFDLPNDLGHRHIFVYKKISEPKIDLPRSIGEAKRNPLA